MAGVSTLMYPNFSKAGLKLGRGRCKTSALITFWVMNKLWRFRYPIRTGRIYRVL
jgi:hypothetical protein